MQVKILNKALFVCIRKIHMLQIHITLCIRKPHGVRILSKLGLFLHQFKNARCTGNRILKFCNHTGNLIKRLGILVCIA